MTRDAEGERDTSGPSSEREQAAAVLRQLADAVEQDRDLRLDGRLVLRRWRPVTRRALLDWARDSWTAPPTDEDRTLTLGFALREEPPDPGPPA